MADGSSDTSHIKKSGAEILAGRLRRLRIARGLTQRKMALALGLGAHSNIADYESGRRIPQNDILLAYERYFGLPSAELQRLRVRALATRAGAAGLNGSAAARQPRQTLSRHAQMAPLAREDPSELGGFQLIGRLGRGTLGQSYLALAANASPVVVKVADQELAAVQGFRSRLSDRLNALQAVSSPWVASVICADTDARQPWIALAYVPGPSIAEITGAHGPLPPPVVRALAHGIAEAVTRLHRANVTHLPLSPAKIRLGGQGPVIIDTGICHAATGIRHSGSTAPDGHPMHGTLKLVNAPGTGPSADVFAIGTILAYAATGVSPSGSHLGQVPAGMAQHCQDDILAELITSCLNGDPSLRPRPAQIIETLNPGREHIPRAAPTPAASPPAAACSPREIVRGRFRVPARSTLALTGVGSVISVLAVTALTVLPGHRHVTHHTVAEAGGPASATAQAYDEYGCVGRHQVPPTVRLDPPGNPRDAGWQSSTPRQWDTPFCTPQIWWAPYVNSGANPFVQFSWTFRTSIPHPVTCTVWAYYPPPPSGHSGRTAWYSIYEGSMYGSSSPLHRLARVTVDQFRYRGTWHPLGAYRVSRGLIRITLDNTGTDPDPEHGPIAGPVHLSCS